MAAAERVLPERAAPRESRQPQKEGPRRAGGHKKCGILWAGERITLGSDSVEAQSAPPNHKVLALMSIGRSVAE